MAWCLLGVAEAWSHPGDHHPPPPPKPIKPPPFSPGTYGKGDPVPNRFDTDAGQTTGGIAYAWTIEAVGNLTANLSGIVGASSWSDPEILSLGEGWTRASSWVALRLRSPSRVTVRIDRASGISDPLALLPGGVGGSGLRPAFTLYRGWQQAGAEEAIYPSQGAVPWAPSLSYLSHASGNGGGTVTAAFELPAGLYSLSLGGIGEPGFDEGRQGYVASVSILSRALPASVIVKGRFSTRKKRYRLKGRFRNPDSAALLAVQQNKKTRFHQAKGSAWSVMISGLKPDRNYLYLTAVSHDGRVSPRKRVIVIRR